jgi:hypothetical protein
MNGRLFDYQLGRFLGVDPVIQFPTNSQSLNPYSYILNNPLAGRDPSGYEAEIKNFSCTGMTGTHICGPTTGAQGGQTTYSGRVTSTNPNTGAATTTRFSVGASDGKVVSFTQTGASLPNGARAGAGTKPTAQTDGSKNGASRIDDQERDPGQQQLTAAAEFGRAFGEAGQQVLNTVNPGEPENLVGGMIVGKVARVGKGLIERGLDSVTQKLLGEKAAQEGIEGVVSRYWARSEFDGIRVYQRSDLIDPAMTDRLGRTNLELMRMGRAPLGSDGFPVNLHHMLQTNTSPLAEVTQTFHQQYSNILHINPNTIPSGINRGAFDRYRANYWRARAKDFEGN